MQKKENNQKGLLRFGYVLCAVLAVFVIWLATTLGKNVWITILLGVGYIAVCALLLKLFYFLSLDREQRRPSGPLLSTIMYDTINASKEPSLICDNEGKIVWNNKEAQTLAGTQILGAKVSAVFPYRIANDETNTLTTSVGNNHYVIERKKIKSKDKTFYLMMFRDVTEINRLKDFIADEENVVAYIMVDNLADLLQFEQEQYREVASKIETMIRAWAQDVDGIVKEYERDKYLFVFKKKNLQVFMENKFDILDKVREIRVGTGSLPVTVSIGIGSIGGTLEEKEKAAHVALDMALQRGGDQVVVKMDDNIEFYGGRTNATHKRTKVRARVVSAELISLIAKAGNVLVMAHKFPDYDALGASVGIARFAMFCGVKVNIVTNLKEPNVRKMLKYFANDESYKGVFIDAQTGLDNIRSDTLLVLCDVNNREMFESEDIANNVYDIVVIDHHRKTAEFEKEPKITYIESSASSASELVAEMLEQSLPPDNLRATEAQMLLAGIVLDTKQFSKGTGTKTYAAAMYLRDHGASYEDIQDLFKNNVEEYKQEALFGERVELYRHCVAIAVNPNASSSNVRVLASRVADDLLTVEEVCASFAVACVGDTIHISARSNGTINVQLILEALSGGGRYDAAGAQVQNLPLPETLLKLKQAIDNYLDPEDK